MILVRRREARTHLSISTKILCKQRKKAIEREKDKVRVRQIEERERIEEREKVRQQRIK